jgi:hypothetical protein
MVPNRWIFLSKKKIASVTSNMALTTVFISFKDAAVLSTMSLGIMVLGIKTLGTMILVIMTHDIMTLSL